MPTWDEETGERIWQSEEWEASRALKLLWEVHDITSVLSDYPLWCAKDVLAKYDVPWRSIGPWRDDVVEITLEATARTLKGYDERKGALSTFIYTTVRNAIVDFLRGMKRRRRQRRELTMQASQDGDTFDATDGLDMPWRITFLRWRRTLVDEAIKELPGPLQDVVRARYGFDPYPSRHKRPNTEVASLLKVHRDTVARRHRRAQAALRAMNLPSALLEEPEEGSWLPNAVPLAS